MGLLTVPRYDTAQDLQLRLNNSVVMYKGRPSYVGQGLQRTPDGANDLFLDVMDMLTGKFLPDRVHSSDEELDIRSQRLGYINHNKQAMYVARMPCRKQRQGLVRENTYVYYPASAGSVGRQINHIQADTLRSKAFAEMMINDYPSFQKALRKLQDDKTTSVAFGRKLMLSENEIGLVVLHFFTNPIAFLDKKREVFHLTEKFEHYLPVLKAHDVPVEISD